MEPDTILCENRQNRIILYTNLNEKINKILNIYQQNIIRTIKSQN